MAGKQLHYAVRVDRKHQDASFPMVVKKIAEAGMKIERQLPAIGVVTGFVDDDKVDAVKKVEGVTSVAEAKKVGIM
jgi:hypothetical protein